MINKEQKKYLVFAAIILVICFAFFFLRGCQSVKNRSSELGELNLKENGDEILTIDPYNEDWQEADRLLDEQQPYSVGIIDTNGYLTKTGFLPIKAHFIKCEAIGTYLYENNCYSDNVEVTWAKKEGNNSYFIVVPIDYPDKQLTITWYGMTEEFAFNLQTIGEP